MPKFIQSLIAMGLVASLVCGCAGGAGAGPGLSFGSSPPPVTIPPPLQPLPSFSPLTALLPTQPNGAPPAPTGAQTPPSSAITFTCWDACGAGAGAVLKLSGVGLNQQRAVTPMTLTMALDASLRPTSIWVGDTAPRGTWVRGTEAFYSGFVPLSAGTRFDYVYAYDGGSTDPVNEITVSAPSSLKFMSFGWWGGSQSFAVGLETPGASIPVTGSATFSGTLAGQYNRSSTPADYVTVAAPMSLAVNFGARTANFASAAWSDFSQTYNGTALSGSMSYNAQQNSLSGTLTTANGTYAGPVVARFFGGSAQEVGGSFVLTPTGTAGGGMVGAFGAAR